MALRPGSKTRARVRVISDGQERRRGDYLATEEPLEIRLVAGGATERLAVTMRTPGNDFELAAGFLHGEGILDGREALRGISYCTGPELDAAQQYNVVNVRLDGAAMPDLRGLERHFYTSSACGVCGKASLDAIELRGCPLPSPGPDVDAEVLYGLPDKLRDHAEGAGGRGAGRVCGVGAVEPGGRRGRAVRHDAGRLPPRPPLQPLRRPRARPPPGPRRAVERPDHRRGRRGAAESASEVPRGGGAPPRLSPAGGPTCSRSGRGRASERAAKDVGIPERGRAVALGCRPCDRRTRAERLTPRIDGGAVGRVACVVPDRHRRLVLLALPPSDPHPSPPCGFVETELPCGEPGTGRAADNAPQSDERRGGVGRYTSVPVASPI